MKKSFFSLGFIMLLLFIQVVQAQDTIPRKTEKIKTGWTFGAVPAIAFDTDIGFKYGGVVNFYNFGDGKTYPKYLHSIFLEWSRTTKGSGINQFIYDSEYLIPGIRITAEASLLTEKALDFYGFNGYNSYFNANYQDDASPEYISRMYYRHDRRLMRVKSDFIGKLPLPGLRWLAGFAHYNNKIGTVDIKKLNKGQDEDKLLPDTLLLYDKYVQSGIIPIDEATGGITNLVKVGLVYDTRDNEPNPMKGLWTDVQLLFAPSFLGNDYAYTRIALTHRQYFTLVPQRFSFAYRVSYQAKLTGTMPFYMLPFVFNSAPALTRDGLGGAKTIRGVMRNRITGEDFLYGNFETRYKFYRGIVLNQNVYVALLTFLDWGTITGKYNFDTSGVDQSTSEGKEFMKELNYKDESIHMGYGLGLNVALNENFVVAFNYGRAVSKLDGNSGFYIGLNFLF